MIADGARPYNTYGLPERLPSSILLGIVIVNEVHHTYNSFQQLAIEHQEQRFHQHLDVATGAVRLRTGLGQHGPADERDISQRSRRSLRLRHERQRGDDIVSETVYDAAGRAFQSIDSLGRIIEYTYDELGRTVEIAVPLSRVNYLYDVRGNVVDQFTTGGGDLVGRLAGESDPRRGGKPLQRPPFSMVVDEADSVHIEDVGTPLIIAGAALRGRTHYSQGHELRVRAMTLNLMVIRRNEVLDGAPHDFRREARLVNVMEATICLVLVCQSEVVRRPMWTFADAPPRPF